ncbi:hypothetical protein [Aromatoleum aromaticum]|uniref:hypothetical protein n=1 Tax=Aromatoleum aromaticum TaxID=551760 RepID=UPI0012FF409D|nr:hypothetical protein [Aromatoleum aromaticum]NMG53279.1 hypothetical protein [Aromatoleum aromaticum]
MRQETRADFLELTLGALLLRFPLHRHAQFRRSHFPKLGRIRVLSTGVSEA